jgi:protein-L-isoaspartate(D-aspartate) O-methyltransferase
MRALLILLLTGMPLAVAGAEPKRPDRDVLLEAEQAGRAGVPTLDAPRKDERERMVRTQIEARGVDDRAVLDAMRAVPRHRLVPEARRSRAYDDRPLPIGHGQTISQPYIVAYMTEQLDLQPGDRVLEVGTGSGYQAAVLGAMGVDVVTIEIIRPLAEQAAERLDAMGFDNITVFHGDGYFGHEPQAPYQAIIVTAAAQHVPPPLVRQLEAGGRMVIPVGRAGWTQNLLRVEKEQDGSTRTRNLMSVAFVPLTGER